MRSTVIGAEVGVFHSILKATLCDRYYLFSLAIQNSHRIRMPWV